MPRMLRHSKDISAQGRVRKGKNIAPQVGLEYSRLEYGRLEYGRLEYSGSRHSDTSKELSPMIFPL